MNAKGNSIRHKDFGADLGANPNFTTYLLWDLGEIIPFLM